METILLKRKTTAGGIQLGDLVPNEIGIDEFGGLVVRKRNDGTALDVIGKFGSANQTDIAQALLAYYTKTEVDSLIANAGGGDLLAANNLNDLANVVSARTNLDVRSTAQITTEITNAIAAVTLASLGGLNQAEVDARASAIIAAEFNSAPAAYDNLQKIFAELEADDNDAQALLVTVGNKLDKDGVIDGGVIG